MANIQGQRLSINEDAVQQFVMSFDVSIQRIKTVLDSLKEANDSFVNELIGDTRSYCSYAAGCIEKHVSTAQGRLSYTNFLVQWNSHQFVRIDCDAGQTANMER